MAAKKPVAQAVGKALVNWEEQLAKFADIATETEKNAGSGAPQLGTRGGVFSFQNEELGNEIEVIVLHHILENKLYAGRYDPDNPAPPVCYAFGDDDETMVPHEEVENPQHESCKGCPHNEFGSSDTGRGKACKNTRRLGLIMSGDVDSIEDAQVAFLNIPVTSVGAWSTYVKSLAKNLRRPPFGVITLITMRPDPKTQFSMSFKVVSQIDDPAHFEALVKRRALVEQEILYTYPKPEDMPAPAPKASKVRGRPTPTTAPKPTPARGRR